MLKTVSVSVFMLCAGIWIAGCNAESAGTSGDAHPAPSSCDPGNGGITLPDGFCATVFADHLGSARHIAVSPDGVVYVHLRRANHGGTVVALKDTDGDGRADLTRRFGKHADTGIAIYHGYLYVASITTIRRYRLPKKGLVPKGKPQIIVQDIPEQSEHAARSITISDSGVLYLNSGAPSNACQKRDRAKHSKGVDPCPLLKHHGGIFRFSATQTHQEYTNPGHRFATGIRNAVAIDWNSGDRQLYVVQHGRDQLHGDWPELYTAKESARLPAEEFLQVDKGDNFGWPYCYYDGQRRKNVLAPEYGGDGKKIGRCSQYKKPILALPAHWAPDGLLFYTGKQFPARYRDGAFIAFHGSWNRAPLPQKGYNVVFVPFRNGKPEDHKWTVFADGFAGKSKLASPSEAAHRPVGLAQGPKGALYITDDKGGRVWRVTYQ